MNIAYECDVVYVVHTVGAPDTCTIVVGTEYSLQLAVVGAVFGIELMLY